MSINIVSSILIPSPSQEAREALAWFRGLSVADPALESELSALPPAEEAQSSWGLAKEMRKLLYTVLYDGSVVGVPWYQHVLWFW